ncbi:MAG: EAL domain-containing protein, partial [Spirochaetota bacterium]
KLSVDEYAILVSEEMTQESASAFAHHVSREIARSPISRGSNEIFVRITIGMALGSLIQGEKSFEEIIVRADMALKRAKHSGKKYLLYNETMQISKEYEKNMMWARKLRNAIDSDRIVPFFQPISNNITGKFEKFECLVRLIDDDGTVTAPAVFLDIARKSRLYPEITRIVLKKSIDNFRDTPYEFSVNISIDDILDEDTRSFIISIMKENPSVCGRILFELLESQEIESYTEVTEFISEVKSLGAHIAVDDFGTGYSNFEHILKLNIDYIKIDASLIKNIHLDRNSMAIVKTISVFARELGIKTVAEFVHCREVHEKGIELGIDYSQGFYLGKPEAGIAGNSA